MRNTAKGRSSVIVPEVKDVTSQPGITKNFSMKEISRSNVYDMLTQQLHVLKLISPRQRVSNLTVKTPGFDNYHIWLTEEKD